MTLLDCSCNLAEGVLARKMTSFSASEIINKLYNKYNIYIYIFFFCSGDGLFKAGNEELHICYQV